MAGQGPPMIRAILFDKDGTLTDFRATWEPWMARMIPELARAGEADAEGLAEDFGFDLANGTIPPDARFVTAPGYVTVELAAGRIGWTVERLSDWLAPRSALVKQIVVPGAAAMLHRFSAAGWPMGILTNADVAETERHLTGMGVRSTIGRIIGHDSGFGPKPDPRGAADFADALGLGRDEVVMIGDGMTDMAAARDAGLVAIGVLTGTLDRAALSPHAAVVLPDVTHLPAWLAERASAK